MKLIKPSSKRKLKMLPYYFLLPPIIFLAVIVVYPLIFSLKLALFDWNLINLREREFVGLGNFLRLITDGSFWNSVRVTFTYAALATSIEFFLGLLLALIASQELKGIRFLRTLLLVPMMVAPLVVGLMWRYLLNANYGVINYFIKHFLRIIPPEWLSHPSWALPTLIFVDVWQWTPFMFIILLAGIQSLPKYPSEAAQIDGAKGYQILWHITLPLLRPVILVALLLRLIDSFRVYDLVYSMTRGGPINKTETLSWYIYQVGFKFFDFGYAAALSWVMLGITMVMCSQLFRVISRGTKEQ
ncbi:sugar ABC transporter permease [Thermatribacter velox]|uniref:Sugar ABC transporter permease n=1 Tax=Thermatribacter velox TaxID=3039681 RepID=A0ABZ2YAQ7_9BACT